MKLSMMLKVTLILWRGFIFCLDLIITLTNVLMDNFYPGFLFYMDKLILEFANETFCFYQSFRVTINQV